MGKDSRQAFEIFSQHGLLKVDFDYFIRLFEEYYLSDDPADLGNFVNGKLEFPLVEEEEEAQEQPLSFDEQIEKNRDDKMEERASMGEEKECKPKKGRKK